MNYKSKESKPEIGESIAERTKIRRRKSDEQSDQLL